MSGIFAPGLQLKQRATVRRLRELPIEGEILVKVGDQVSESAVVARAFLPGDLRILRPAESLGIQATDVLKGLKIMVGDAVHEGQLLVEHSGLFGLLKSRFHSPLSGVVELITHETAHIGVRSPSRPLECSAYISGRVAQINSGRSVIIESEATFAQGIFGVGGERCGVLRVLQIAPDKVITQEDLGAVQPGDIIFGGTLPDGETLKAAAARGAVGMIIGGIDDRALASYLGFDLGIALTGDEKVSMTLIITEGFGQLPISSGIFEILSACNGKKVSINGATQVRAGAIRPEIIIPQAATETQQSNDERSTTLTCGSFIRIIRVPYFGQYGEVTELPRDLVLLESGTQARVLKARLRSGETVTVPRANVELA